jgi:TonB family protein
MADRVPNPLRGLSGAALALAGLACVSVALAQSDAPDLSPVVVDRKKATRLVVRQVYPEYPALAKINFIQGQVLVQLLVSSGGRVAQAHVLEGHPILAAATLHAVRGWTYHPLMTARGPAKFLTTVSVNFTLRFRKIDLLPTQAETDLSRQVKPPEVVNRPADPPANSSVHLRVLLSDQGQIIDTQPLKGPPANFEEARKAVEEWTFRPARWGALHVPWYLEVDVPVSDSAIQPAADPGGR